MSVQNDVHSLLSYNASTNADGSAMSSLVLWR